MIPFKKAVAIVNAHIAKGADEREKWDKYHAWYLGEFWSADGEPEPDDELTLETNYPYMYVDTMTANVCPTNPMLTIDPLSADRKDSAKARALLVNSNLKRDKMAAKSQAIATFGAICGRGVSKTVWNSRTGRPTTHIVDPRRFFYDMSVTTDWEDVKYVCEAVPLTKEEFDSRVAKGDYNAKAAETVAPGAYPTWMQDSQGDQWFLDGTNADMFQWVVVYEFYDLRGDKMMHFLENAEVPLHEGPLPYRYMRNPFSPPVIFNQTLRDGGGISDIKLIEKAQERLNELDTLELIFVKTCIPVTYANTNAFDNPEDAKTQLQKASMPGAIVTLALKNQYTMEQAVTFSKMPGLSPNFDKSRTEAKTIIVQTLGLPDYQRGSYGGAQVATELAMVDTATRTRNGRRIHVLEDWIVEVSKRVLAIWKEYLDDRKGPMLVKDQLTADSIELDRAALAFPMPESGKLPPEQFDDEWFYAYEAASYSPTENNRLVQLQKLQQFIGVLGKLPGVDLQALTNKLLELLDLEDIKGEPGQPSGMPPVEGQPGVPGSAGLSGTPADLLSKPGPSQATEAILPPETRGNASQPLV